MVQAAVRRDAVQPRAQRPAVEAVEGAPCGHQDLLKHILGVLQRPERSIAVHEQLPPVGLDELGERVAVAGAGTAEDRLVHLAHVFLGGLHDGTNTKRPADSSAS